MTDRGYICHGCAARRKGEWPEGHRASAHEGKCAYCAQTGMLTSITDWRWPSAAAVGEAARSPAEEPQS
jgi:hypothetical protein